MSSSSTSSSTASNLITVTIEFLDGVKEDFSISNLKSVSALIELLVKAKGRAVHGLTKNGIKIPLREMIKYIPIVSGDVLKEIPGTGSYTNIPKSAIQNTILRNQVRSGAVSADDVIELRVLYNSILGRETYGDVLVRKNATLNDLKKIISEKRGVPVKELGNQLGARESLSELFGWTNIFTRGRSYDGAVSLESLGLRDGMTIIEYDLPRIPTKSNIYKQKTNSGELPVQNRIAVEFLLQGTPEQPNRISRIIYIPKDITIDELKEYIVDEIQRPIQEIAITHEPYSNQASILGWVQNRDGSISYDGKIGFVRYYTSFSRLPVIIEVKKPQARPQPTPPPSSSRSSVPTDECDKLLQGLSIIDKATFNEWARKGGHPDKTPHKQGTKEWEEANELFKKVHECCEKKGFFEKKGGKRRSRRYRKQSKRTRKN